MLFGYFFSISIRAVVCFHLDLRVTLIMNYDKSQAPHLPQPTIDQIYPSYPILLPMEDKHHMKTLGMTYLEW